MLMLNIRYAAVAIASCTVVAAPALAETLTYTTELTAEAEVPPTESSATGTADVKIDTEAKTVSWTVTYDGLTGEATAAHIHGPASETESAGPVIDMSASIMEGSGDITDEQIGELEAGKYYVNVHTEEYPAGEIRGQLTKAE